MEREFPKVGGNNHGGHGRVPVREKAPGTALVFGVLRHITMAQCVLLASIAHVQVLLSWAGAHQQCPSSLVDHLGQDQKDLRRAIGTSHSRDSVCNLLAESLHRQGPPLEHLGRSLLSTRVPGGRQFIHGLRHAAHPRLLPCPVMSGAPSSTSGRQDVK